MQFNTVIDQQANITSILSVRVGDVYKRVFKPSYGDETIVVGTIIDILNDGENVVVEALEFTPRDYGSDIRPCRRIFRGDAPIVVFPAVVDEYRQYLREVIEIQERAVAAAANDLEGKRTILRAMEDAMGAELHAVETAKVLSLPAGE